MSDSPHTRNEAKQQSNKPQPKVVAATIGAGVGAAASVIAVWIVEQSFKITVPEEVKFSAGVVLSAGLTFIGGYFKTNN
jgi:hypothetical protein